MASGSEKYAVINAIRANTTKAKKRSTKVEPYSVPEGMPF